MPGTDLGRPLPPVRLRRHRPTSRDIGFSSCCPATRSLRSTGAFEADAHMHDLAAPPGTVTPSFIDAVLAEISTLARPVCLVLDDVHVLRQTAALETIGLLIRRLPPALRVVLVGRTEPPLGLARLRVHGDVRDVRAADLAFTLEETAAYLAAQGVDVLRDTLELLHRRTEGWIAGVRIASIALASDPDPRSLIERFTGDDQAIAVLRTYLQLSSSTSRLMGHAGSTASPPRGTPTGMTRGLAGCPADSPVDVPLGPVRGRRRSRSRRP
jgi:hypothetical protein